MFFLIAGVVLFILLGVALAWRMKKATHYRGPGMDSSYQPFTVENEHVHHHHDHHSHDHHHPASAQHSNHQGQSTQQHTPPSVPPTAHIDH